jgi:CRP/FNR family transcriptional regulator, cyclic AMP receptor protein
MGRHEDSVRAVNMSRRGVNLLRVWPDIAEGLDPQERGAVEQALVVPLLRARDEDLAAALEASDAFDFVLVDGTVLKETILTTVSALELLGPGDVLARPVPAHQTDLRGVSRYLALGDVSIAALETRFQRVAARWPQVSTFLHGQIAEQAHRASLHLAMLHLPRAEERILALFTELGDRFGRVNPDGILIDLPLSHELIGRLTACRRPTATLALQFLHDRGLLTRVADDSWKLAMRPPAAEVGA